MLASHLHNTYSAKHAAAKSCKVKLTIECCKRDGFPPCLASEGAVEGLQNVRQDPDQWVLYVTVNGSTAKYQD